MVFKYDSKILKALIENEGMSLGKFCRKLGVSRSIVAKYIDDNIGINNTLKVLADYFNVSFDEILGRNINISPEDFINEYNLRRINQKRAQYEAETFSNTPKEKSDTTDTKTPWPYNLLEIVLGEPILRPVTDSRSNDILGVLDSLSKSERACILGLYQLGKSRKELARELGVRAERIHLYRKNALAKLKKPPLLDVLRFGKEIAEKNSVMGKKKAELEAKISIVRAMQDEVDRLERRVEELRAEAKSLGLTDVAKAIDELPLMSLPVAELDLGPRGYRASALGGCDPLDY